MILNLNQIVVADLELRRESGCSKRQDFTVLAIDVEIPPNLESDRLQEIANQFKIPITRVRFLSFYLESFSNSLWKGWPDMIQYSY